MRLILAGAVAAGAVAFSCACTSYMEDTSRSITVFEEDAASYVSNLSINSPRECEDTMVTISGTTRFNHQRIYLSDSSYQQSTSTLLAETDDFVIESLPLPVPRIHEEVHYTVGSMSEDGAQQVIAHIVVDERGCLG